MLVKNNKKHRGFTLIELLVVLAIIAVLASVVALSYMKAQKQSRNAKRTADLTEISTAVRSYYEIKNSLPDSRVTSGWCRIGINHSGSTGTCLGELQTDGYLSVLPKGPEGKCPDTNDAGYALTVNKQNCYAYHNYTTGSGGYAIVVGYQEPYEYGPFPKGWHCSDTASDAGGGAETGASVKSYCMGFDY